MKQRFVATLLWALAVSAAQAHFIFVVPDERGSTARVFLSENLEPSGIGAELAGRAELTLRDARGKEHALDLNLQGEHYVTALPGGGLRVVHGTADLGVMNRGTAHRLLYYPKTILGDAFDPSTRVGSQAVVEIVPHGEPGDLRLQVLAMGDPKPDSEMTVIFPSGEERVVRTDACGMTEAFSEKGRYGAWARHWEDKGGDLDGKSYEQTRHYAMLVFDADGVAAAASSESTAESFATMPEETSSFGAAVADGWLYVYGGHVSPTHDYSTEAVSGAFHRMKLSGGDWEKLPPGPALQGMNLAAYDGAVYRIGGMAPVNKPGDPTDNRSVASAARFNPETRRWEDLPDLPAPRSSHDVAVVDGVLYVVGGWEMRADNTEDWAETMLALDLNSKDAEWRTIAQPFQRRALMTAAYQGGIYVVGGFSPSHEVMRTVSIYDPATGAWSEAPELPQRGRTTGFAPAAGVHDGKLYVSIDDGALLRLSKARNRWEEVGRSTPRLAHRIASHEEGVLVLGGAAGGKNFNLVELIRPR